MREMRFCRLERPFRKQKKRAPQRSSRFVQRTRSTDSGLLGRADRLVILALATAFQVALDPGATHLLGLAGAQFTYLGWAMALFAILGNVTAIQRAISTWRLLS